jgi:nicotinate-nucleotide adenylyltransferase
LLIGECAYDQFHLDKVLYVTSPVPPHRRTGLLDAEHRYAMVAAAVADNNHFEASRMELDREGPSYTVDTVMSMRQMYGPNTEIDLIIGGDNVRTMRNWHRFEDLSELCRFLVAPRLIYERALSAKPSALSNPVTTETSARYDIAGARVAVIDFPPVSISSSMVRKRLQEGRSVLYLVPKIVNEMLVKEKYYAAENFSNA